MTTNLSSALSGWAQPNAARQSAAQSAAADSTEDSTKKPATSSTDQLANKTVFLQLLVSQIKNQNPLEPADSIQYITQLNQFSATEQLVEIRKLLEDATGGSQTQTGGRI